ncbi:hypothetical protein BKG89_08600 [Rodentibacter caecimuris]|uniref:Glycosyl transferase n=2 Tax=Rodentibacter caecimuris TaxID=1796644 RepID=A0ABX3KVJ6_9PAST|nr:hypothetical protein BKG89_08600 [Rodentibacter heylii]
MNIVLLTFGKNLENHYQAAFCILTFLKDKNIKNIIVLTDSPEFYQFISEYVKIILITEEILSEWQGEYRFFWRIKIKALEFIFRKYPDEHLFYVDSDIFLAKNLDLIHRGLDKGRSFMHKKEYLFSDKGDSNTERKMIACLNNKIFSGIQFNENTPMWNAGVIALPKEKAAALINLSLNICDEICATDCPRRLVEQLSFSVALNHLTELFACEDEIGHYWGNKIEWNEMISQFFIQKSLKKMTVKDCIRQLQDFDWQSIPLEKKVRSTNKRFKQIIDKFFPPKSIRFF